MLEYAVLDLLLGEVYVVWEQLKELLASSTFPFFFLLQFQIPCVDSGVHLARHSIQQHVYADVERVLQHVLKAANTATQVTLLEDVSQQAMAAESVAALQSHRLHKHLEANRTAELLAQKFLLDLADESWVGAVAVRWSIRPLVHCPIHSCVYRRV